MEENLTITQQIAKKLYRHDTKYPNLIVDLNGAIALCKIDVRTYNLQRIELEKENNVEGKIKQWEDNILLISVPEAQKETHSGGNDVIIMSDELKTLLLDKLGLFIHYDDIKPSMLASLFLSFEYIAENIEKLI